MDWLDASALIALLNDEPGATEVEDVLTDRQSGITAVHLAEVANVLSRRRRTPVRDLERAVEAIPGLELVPITVATGWRAGDLRSRHYHRTRCAVSLADCLLVAVAGAHDRIVARDRSLIAVARAEGIEVVALPERR